MLNLLKALRQDEYGVILSTEIVIIGSLLVIGLITGLTCLQNSVNGELQDLAGAVGSLDQSYSFSGHRKSGYGGRCCAYTAGSAFVNCERNGEYRGDIVGCDASCVRQPVASANCSSCNHCGRCNNCVGGPAGAACGTCGGRAGGCSDCGSGAVGGSGPQCVDTGVPKMKVTEWPSSDCPVDTVIPSQHVPIDESDVIIPSNPTGNEQIFPIPEARHVPGFPMPSTDYLRRGASHFVIPSHVW